MRTDLNIEACRMKVWHVYRPALLAEHSFIESCQPWSSAHRERNTIYPERSIYVLCSGRNPLVARCNIFYQERNYSGPWRLRHSKHPFEKVAIRPQAAERHRIADRRSRSPK